MTLQEELDRQRAINVELRRKLEKSRRDTVEYCAKFCEDHDVEYTEYGIVTVPTKKSGWVGKGYAEGLRGIIGK